jgi:hypothetical protein
MQLEATQINIANITYLVFLLKVVGKLDLGSKLPVVSIFETKAISSFEPSEIHHMRSRQRPKTKVGPKPILTLH